MSWLPDSGWLRALDLRASTAAAVSLACWGVLGLAEYDLLYLGVLPAWGRAGFVVVAVLASALWLGRIGDLGLRRFMGWQRRRAVLEQLGRLSTSETQLLDEQAAKNEQTFNAAVDDPVVVGLRRKGLLVRPTGIGNPFDYPHIIPDFVWNKLRRLWEVSKHRQSPSEAAQSAARRPPRPRRI